MSNEDSVSKVIGSRIVVAAVIIALAILGVELLREWHVARPSATGEIETVDFARHAVANRPPFGYQSWTEYYMSGGDSLFAQEYDYVNLRTGQVTVRLLNGTRVECRNPYPQLEKGDTVKVVLLENGEWLVARFDLAGD